MNFNYAFWCLIVVATLPMTCRPWSGHTHSTLPTTWKYESIAYNMFGIPFDTTVYSVNVQTEQYNGDTLVRQLSDGMTINIVEGRMIYSDRFGNKNYPIYDSDAAVTMAPKMVVTIDRDTTIYNLVIRKTGTFTTSDGKYYEFTTPRTISRDSSSFYQKRVTKLSNKDGILSLAFYDERDSLTNYTRLIESHE